MKKHPESNIVARRSEPSGFHSEKPIGGKFNNLIQRMTGGKERPITSKEMGQEEKQFTDMKESQDTEKKENEKLEIPAFLRRQAN